MLAVERLQYIEELLQKNKVVLVSDLSREIQVTEETIRKDLEKLEERQVLCRVHGGAYLNEGYGREAPISVREKIYQQEKEKLAGKCLGYIAQKDSILLDFSTTSLYIAKQLADSDIKCTVITNSLPIAQEISKAANIRLLMLGGRLQRDTDSFMGQGTIYSLKQYHVDKIFISSAGISSEAGMTDYTQEESELRRAMMERAGRRFFVGDATKIGRTALYVTSGLERLDTVILESPTEHSDQKLFDEFQRLKVTVDWYENQD